MSEFKEFKSRIMCRTLESTEGAFDATQFAESVGGARYFPEDEDIDVGEEHIEAWGVQFQSTEGGVVLPSVAAAVGALGGRIEDSEWGDWDVYV